MEDSRSDQPLGEPRSGRRANERDEGDAILRKLVGMDPSAFLKLIGMPATGPIEVIEAGIFPHILPIDKVLRISSPKPWIAVIGLVTSRDPSIVGEVKVTLISLLLYDVPIAPMVVLVRPEADDPSISGEEVQRLPSGKVVSQFRYEVVRAWQQPSDQSLRDVLQEMLAELGTSGLSELISELRERADECAEGAAVESVMCLVFALPEQGVVDPKLLTAVAELERMAPCVFLGLNGRDEYRIVSRDEGCTVMRWKLYQRGARRFGQPDERVAATIGEISSPRRLTDLDHFMARIDSKDYPITSWDELLAWREPTEDSGGSPTA